MHEYPITVSIIETAERRARECGASAVVSINIVVGEYSGYMADSIAMYFDLLTEGTICHGAELNFERIKPKLQCTSCKEYFERRPFEFTCPHCGGEGEPTGIGREFYIKSINVGEIQDERDSGDGGNLPAQ